MLRTLVEKYNRPGPRYTSYPTALQFAEIDDPQAFLLAESDSTRPISLYFHLPFCESLCWFCACTTVISLNRNLADTYIDALEREMDATLPYLNLGQRTVAQLHFGGGSPSFLTPEQLDRLCAGIRARFPFDPDAECSVELDPRTLSEDKVQVLARHGFNRASFGVQDVDPAVQLAVHRIQPDELNRRCLEWIRSAGFDSINVDLIYGLPKQSPESFARTVETVRSYAPDRLAVFSYAHVPWVAPAQKILERDQLPPPQDKFTMLWQTIETLTRHGYAYIGMDHFARAEDEITHALHNGSLHRNFQGYTTKAGTELIGFGMSSISMSEHRYRQNHKELDAWHACLRENRLPTIRGCLLSDEDRLRREIIMTIMCSGRVSFERFNASYGIDFTSRFASALAALEEPARDGLIERDAHGFQVTATGRLLLRNIAMPFDAHYVEGPKRHAKTI